MPGLENLKWLPKGREGTRQTIEEMKKLVDEGKKNFQVATLASDIVSPARERDARGEINRLFVWVKQNIRFINDPYQVEMIQAPLYTIQRGAGDCDDLSTLLNALASSIGYNTAFKTIKADKRVPEDFSHVYSLIDIYGEWVPADASQKTRPLGWEPPSQWGYQIWGYSKGTITRRDVPASNLKGLGMPKENLKDKVMSLIARIGKKANMMTRAPIPVPAVSAEPIARPGNRYGQNSSVMTPYDERPYDSEVHTYYGDYDDEGAGQYNDMHMETLPKAEQAVSVIHKLPKVKGPEYYKNRLLDDKMVTRISEDIPYRTAIKDGTPELR